MTALPKIAGRPHRYQEISSNTSMLVTFNTKACDDSASTGGLGLRVIADRWLFRPLNISAATDEELAPEDSLWSGQINLT